LRRAFLPGLWIAVLALPAWVGLAIVGFPIALLGLPVSLAAAWALPPLAWPETSGRTGFVLLLLGAAATVIASFPAFFYAYAISISAGLCGDERNDAVLTAAFFAGYAVVGSWALRDRGRLWVWPLAVFAGASVALLVAYAMPSAHGACET
jgi:hypothetical protein